MTWLLVPPKPKELTLARRGVWASVVGQICGTVGNHI
jgi:hypothetical protein